MAEQPAKVPWYKQPHLWAALASIGSILGMTCPLWPAPYNAVCHAVSQGAKTGSELGRQVTGAPSSSPAPASPGACSDGQVQSVPHFCKCVDGAWRDYFDAGTPCGG